MAENKKSEFQKEIEANERRLREIYDKILGIYTPVNNAELTEEEYIVA